MMIYFNEACKMARACGASILLTMSRVFILRSAMAHVLRTEVDTRRLRTREMMAQNIDSQNGKAVSALRFSEPLALANSARADVVGSHSIIKFYSNCETSGNTQHGIVRKCSQIGVGISRAFGVLFERKAGATLGKSGFSPVVNFRICREFLQEFILNGFSCNKGSNMENISDLGHLPADAHNNYNGTYRKCGKEGKKEASFLEVRGASLRQGILSLRSAIFLKNGRSLDGAEHRGMTSESYFRAIQAIIISNNSGNSSSINGGVIC